MDLPAPTLARPSRLEAGAGLCRRDEGQPEISGSGVKDASSGAPRARAGAPPAAHTRRAWLAPPTVL